LLAQKLLEVSPSKGSPCEEGPLCTPQLLNDLIYFTCTDKMRGL
jgi:hypothetical protein